MTYDIDLQSQPSQGQCQPHTEYQGRRSNGSAVRVDTDGQTDGRPDATKYIISLALWSTNKKKYFVHFLNVEITLFYGKQSITSCYLEDPTQDGSLQWELPSQLTEKNTLSRRSRQRS